jgi:hypothetical protein
MTRHLRSLLPIVIWRWSRSLSNRLRAPASLSALLCCLYAFCVLLAFVTPASFVLGTSPSPSPAVDTRYRPCLPHDTPLISQTVLILKYIIPDYTGYIYYGGANVGMNGGIMISWVTRMHLEGCPWRDTLADNACAAPWCSGSRRAGATSTSTSSRCDVRCVKSEVAGVGASQRLVSATNLWCMRRLRD